jgi:PAS domain S-box-containing protein
MFFGSTKILLVIIFLFALAFPVQSIRAQETPGAVMSDSQRELMINDLIMKSADHARWSHKARLDFALTAYEYSLDVKDPELRMQAMFQMAELYFQEGSFDKALLYFDSLQIFGSQTNNIPILVKAKCHIGSVYRYRGELLEALGITHDANQIIEESGFDELKSLTYNDLGLIYRSLGDNELAEEYYESALENARNHQDTIQEIRALTYMGNYFRSENEVERAYELYDTAMMLAVQSNAFQNIASLNNNIGNIYRDRGDFDAALEYYLEAFSMIGEVYLVGLETVILRNIGVTFQQKGDINEALSYINKSLELSKETGLKWITRDNYLTLSEIYRTLEEPERAYNYLLSYTGLDREIFNERLLNSIEYFSERVYDAQRREELYRFRWQRNMLLLVISGLGLFFLISLFILILKRFKEKRDHVESLETTLHEKEITEKALKQSEENYQTLIRTLNEGLIVLDLNNKIEFVNFKACKVLGVHDKSELVGRNFKEFLLTTEDERLFNDKMELQKMGISDHYEVKMKNVRGDLLWVNLSSAPILDENLNSKGSVTLITDVSDRKKYEETYSDLTTDLNQKIKQLNCLYDISDISGVPGITFEEIIEKSLEIIPVGLKYSHDIGVQIMFDNRIFTSGNYKETPWSYIVPIKVQKKKLGHIKVVYLEKKPQINKDPFHFNEKILLKNISEKFGQILESKNLEKVLRENQERLQEIQRIAKIGNLEKDLQTNEYSFSGNFFDIAEVSPERRNFFGIEKLAEMVHPEDKETFNELIKDEDYGKSILSFQYRIITQQGIIKNIYSSRKVVVDDKGAPFRVIYTIQDVTEQKINQELKYSAEMALRTSEARQQVLSDMSYEMRTPLNGIMGVVDFLLKSNLTAEQLNLTKTIKDSSEGLMNIVNNIQDLSRIEHGNIEMHNKPFELERFISKISDLFLALTRHKDLTLNTELDKKLPDIVVADENRLNQIITNLISAAVKQNEQGIIGLKIALENKKKDELVLSVSVTDPAKSKTRKFPGLADSIDNISDTDIYRSEDLSLSITQKLVQLMGGQLTIKPDRSKGTLSNFTFVAMQDSKSVKKALKNGVPAKIMNTIKGLKILFAEDKVINQKVVSLMLKHAGIDVTIAGNGEEALKKMREQEFDVILLDMIMPVMDGLETIKTIKTEFSSYPPVIGVTASTMEKNKKNYLENGLDDIITKPVNAAELYEKIAHWHLNKTKKT